jgi:MFS family permease
LKQAASSLAAILGPSLAAPLFFVAGVRWALLLNALSFVISFLAVLAMRVPARAGGEGEEPHESFLRELVEGLRFYAGNRVLVTLLFMNVLALVGYGTVNTLDIFFLTQNLRAPASLYGLLASAQGMGLVAGAALAAAFAQRIGVARVLGVSVAAWGIAVVVFARLTSFAPALVLIGLVGFMVSASQVAETPLLMHVTPQALLGRVAAVLTPALSASELLGIGLSGLLASTALRHFHAVVLGVAVGPIDTIFTVVGLSILAAGVYTLINLRGVRLARAGAPEPAGPPSA